MSAPYSPKAVANAILQRAFNAKIPVTHLKLQKLTYLAHGYYLAFTGVPLIDEPFEAWDYGPVCRDLYDEFRDCGKSPISRLAMEYNWDTDEEIPVAAPTDDPKANQVLDFIVSSYGEWVPFQLSELSHKDGWAWDKTRKEDTFRLRNVDIDNELIKNDFMPYLNNSSDSKNGDPSI